MSVTAASLGRKIASAGDLQSVVRTMKAVAAANLAQYGQSVGALASYVQTVELGLGVCFRQVGTPATAAADIDSGDHGSPSAIVFGSDQGLVGRFNDEIADFASTSLAGLPGEPRVWAIGERVHSRLLEAGLRPVGLLPVPGSIHDVAARVGEILVRCVSPQAQGAELHLFHQRPTASGSCVPTSLRLLPLDREWRGEMARKAWPGRSLPDVIGGVSATLRALIREYLYVSLFRACAESLASENASRLAAMRRADRNIDELLENLSMTFHTVRQNGIDEELFDVISGFEALNTT
ncbi:MAG TPA: F0F1 ATP synthase subunit gamma [Dokdonella sp.]|jgi:F-type H+-transporting ATPase subunit gamma|nr:F0F1 ATP synthase subunit gamma [Dokdonella sp.]